MKKFGAFILTILAALTCFIFSACGSKYSKLDMQFLTESGEVVDSVNLTLDSQNQNSLNQTNLAIKVEGIDVEDIGLLEVRSEPAGLVTVTNYRYSQNYCYVTVTALASCRDSAQLVARHLSSNKTTSIPLHVGEKAHNVTTIGNYLVSIPTASEREIILPTDEICSLEPIGSTDTIYFGCKQQAPNGVTFIKEGSYIKGFKVQPNVENLTEISLYPILVHEGYETKENEFEQVKVNIKFVEELKNENVALSTDEKHIKYLNTNETFVLLYNETTAVDLPTESDYSLNLLNIQMQTVDGKINIASSEEFMKYYKFDYDYNEDYIDVRRESVGEDRIVIRATKYFEQVLEVKLKLVPLFAGELKTIERTLKIKCDMAPTKLDMLMNGEEFDASKNINLYDTYGTSGDGLGTVFTFNCLEENAYSDLRDTHILLAPEVFNAIYDEYAEGKLIKKGNVIGEVPQDIKARTRTNKFVLQYYMQKEDGSNYLKFSYDANLGKFVSETIAPKKDIYVKYVDTGLPKTDKEVALECIVENYYKGDLDYLAEYYNENDAEGKHIRCLTTKLNFEMQSGITALNIEAGNLVYADNLVNVQVLEGKFVENNGWMYLNRDMGIDNTDANAFMFVLRNNAVKNSSNRAVESATFKIKIEGGRDNPMTIKQYNSEIDKDAKTKEGTTSNFVYNYVNSNTPSNAVFFAFDSTTDLGDYKITITSENGYVHVINCKLYEAITKEDISYTLGLNEKCFANMTSDGGRFQYFHGTEMVEYEEDYMDAVSNERINMLARMEDDL
ncbi:MAG: hypothetical protein MJ152_02375, partial [Clostridia bacterium]|nr:hypothetical protein [Clostridia bacterium]